MAAPPVYIGFADLEIPSYKVGIESNFIGGDLIAPPGYASQKLHRHQCHECSSLLLFLMQLYVPLFDSNDHLARCMYVFVCPTQACQVSHRAWKVSLVSWRKPKRDWTVSRKLHIHGTTEPTFSASASPFDTSSAAPQKVLFETNAWGSIGSNPTEISGAYFDSLLESHLGDLQLSSQLARTNQTLLRDVPDHMAAPLKETRAFHGDVSFPLSTLTTSLESDLFKTGPSSAAYSQKELDLLLRYCTEEGLSMQDLSDPSSSSLFAIKQSPEISSNSGQGAAGDLTWGEEVYEKAVPAGFTKQSYKFYKYVSRFPTQILRYSLGGLPVLQHQLSKSTVAERLTCQSCKSELCFEVQIFSYVFEHLKKRLTQCLGAFGLATEAPGSASKVNELLLQASYGVPWTQLLIFTCQNPACNGINSNKPYFHASAQVVIQSDDDTKLEKLTSMLTTG